MACQVASWRGSDKLTGFFFSPPTRSSLSPCVRHGDVVGDNELSSRNDASNKVTVRPRFLFYLLFKQSLATHATLRLRTEQARTTTVSQCSEASANSLVRGESPFVSFQNELAESKKKTHPHNTHTPTHTLETSDSKCAFAELYFLFNKATLLDVILFRILAAT